MYTENIPLYIASYYVTGEDYVLLPNVDMYNGCSAQQKYGAAFSPSRRPSVNVVNQNGCVQLGEKAAEYYL